MTKENKTVLDLSEFEKRHNEQVERRGARDVFFIWLVLMFISVVTAHFILNVTPATPTGYVTAQTDAIENLSILLNAFIVLFVTVLVGLLGYVGISRRDR